METNHNIELELISIIVNFGLGSKVLHKAKKNGALGGTIALAKGISRTFRYKKRNCIYCI